MAHVSNITLVEYRTLKIWTRTWEMLSKVKALLLVRESRSESLVEIVHRLVEAELKRLDSEKKK
jgi:hypothetical protein